MTMERAAEMPVIPSVRNDWRTRPDKPSCGSYLNADNQHYVN